MNSPFAAPKSHKNKRVRQPQNFVEALKSIGGYTVNSIKEDVIKGTLSDAYHQISGTPSGEAAGSRDPDRTSAEWLYRPEIERSEKKRSRHKELVQTPVYDRREEEVKAQIETLRKELKALAQDIALLGASVQKAIEEEISNPGSYHINFFERIISFVVLLRKKVSESKNWLYISAQRMAAKNVYWGNVDRSGTKYMLSSERTLATQTG